MPAPLEVFRARAFEGGRNTQYSPHDLQPSESPSDLNVDGETPGAVRKRRGIQKFVQTQFGADAITGLFPYYKTNGTRYLMVLCGNQLWAGPGRPPAPVVIKNDYSRGSWMTFGTMQDWLYEVNYLDLGYRWDGADFSRVGLALPASSGAVALTPSNSAKGRMTSSVFYTYRFRFKYGNLGLSNLSVNGAEVSMAVGDDQVVVTGMQIFRLGDPACLMPAEARMPTRIQIYRTLGYVPVGTAGAGYFTQPEWEALAMALPFYLVDEIDFPANGAINYTDIKGDDEIVTPYPGHDHSEPYLENVMANGNLAWHAVREGYKLTPKARYIAKHRNRMWYANCQETSWKATVGVAGTQQPYEVKSSRVYWSDLYQADRWGGFVDVFPEDGDEITGIFSFHNNLVVFKRQRTYMILGSSPDNFEPRLVNGYIGCVAPRSVAYLDDLLVFAAADGVYAFDGANFQRISNKIRPDILAILNTDREYMAGGSWRGRYYLAYRER